jgi:hypothetical protein
MSAGRRLSRDLVLVITIITAVALIIDYYYQYDPLNAFANEMNTWAVLFAGWLAALAVVSTTIRSMNEVKTRVPNKWPYSIWLMVCLWGTMGIGAILGPGSTQFEWLFTNVARAVYGAMQATTAFFIVTAAYRSFRARSLETSIMLVVAILVALGNITIGAAIWPGFRPIRDWLYNVPMAFGLSAIYITMAIGAIALGIRTLLGVERGAFGRE